MIFSGVTILQGVEFPIFPIDFAWALQQCSATALPVMIRNEKVTTYFENLAVTVTSYYLNVTSRREIILLRRWTSLAMIPMTTTDEGLVSDVRLGQQTLVETAPDVAVVFHIGDDGDDEVFAPAVPLQSTWAHLPLVR